MQFKLTMTVLLVFLKNPEKDEILTPTDKSFQRAQNSVVTTDEFMVSLIPSGDYYHNYEACRHPEEYLSKSKDALGECIFQ